MKWLGLLLFLLSTQALADVGKITEFSGSATIRRGKESIDASKGASIEMNDKIETKNGKIKITFKDNTTVSITEHSSLIVDDFVYDPKSSSGKLNIKAASGTVRYVSGAIAHNDSKAVNIKTPTASIAVRGTDFIMSVNEIGSSMIILMPSCDLDSVDIENPVCKSGKIDVESGLSTVTLDQAFEATLVETLGGRPTPPILVNLNNTALDNNLQISSPKTTTGVNIVAAARSAAEKTGDQKDNKDDSKDQEKQAVVSNKDNSESKPDKKTVVKEDVIIKEEKIIIGDTNDPNVKVLWRDRSETKQIGWLYVALSTNSQNYTNVVLPLDTQVQVTVVQDFITSTHNFISSGGKSAGSITIVQNYK